MIAEVGRNVTTNVGLIDWLLEKFPEMTYWALERNHRISSKVLSILARRSTPELVRLVAKHSRTSKDLLCEMCRTILGRQPIPPEDVELLKALASNRSMPAELLRDIAYHPLPATPDPAQSKASHALDLVPLIRYFVLFHRRTPSEARLHLARVCAEKRCDCGGSGLHAFDGTAQEWLSLLNLLTVDALARLAGEVRPCAQSRDAVFFFLARHRRHEVRLSLASNFKIPAIFARRLSEDRHLSSIIQKRINLDICRYRTA